MFVPILLGTGREGRQSEKVAKFVDQEVKKAGLETEIIDPRDYLTSPFTQASESSKWAQKIKKAKALIIIVPEYNHGFPGELKLMLDMLYDEYKDKKVLVCGVSTGLWGGARAVELLYPILIELDLKPLHRPLYFPNIKAKKPDTPENKKRLQETLKTLVKT